MKKLTVIIVAAFAMLLSSCAPQTASTSFFAMDTVMSVTAVGSNDDLQACIQEVLRLENLFTVTKKDSDIARINASGTATVSADTLLLINTAKALSAKTEGAFDISVYPAVKLWGFTSDEKHIPTAEQISAMLPFIGYEKIKVDGNAVSVGENMALDLGGIAKGYCSDRIVQILTERGVTSAIISLGGNVYALGTKPNGEPWTVAIQDPNDRSKAIGNINVIDKAVITSGGYNRFFEIDGREYCHILDPATGKPAENGLISVTVVGNNGAEADALSTALYVMGTDKAVRFAVDEELDVILVTEDGRLIISDSLFDSFEASDGYEIERISEAA